MFGLVYMQGSIMPESPLREEFRIFNSNNNDNDPDGYNNCHLPAVYSRCFGISAISTLALIYRGISIMNKMRYTSHKSSSVT